MSDIEMSHQDQARYSSPLPSPDAALIGQWTALLAACRAPNEMVGVTHGEGPRASTIGHLSAEAMAVHALEENARGNNVLANLGTTEQARSGGPERPEALTRVFAVARAMARGRSPTGLRPSPQAR